MEIPLLSAEAASSSAILDERKITGVTIYSIGSEALKLGTKVLVMDQGEIQLYAPPEEILHHPATAFVSRLAEKERRRCYLPDERLEECECSGAGSGPRQNG